MTNNQIYYGKGMLVAYYYIVEVKFKKFVQTVHDQDKYIRIIDNYFGSHLYKLICCH